MAEADDSAVPDGGVLDRLDSGLSIVRRRKHEWSPRLDQLEGNALTDYTSKVRGSKFAREWTLERQVQWVREQLQMLGWDAQTPAQDHTVDVETPIGYSMGRGVTKIRIDLSSRCVHAYPVENG